MRRDAVIATTGALVIVLASVGLVTGALRAGPIDAALEPTTVPVTVTGTYQARAASAGPGGLCLQPPCEARTAVALTFAGLPTGAVYEASLAGGGAQAAIGTLAGHGADHTLRFDAAEDHTDKDLLLIAFHGHDVLAIPVGAAVEPVTLDLVQAARVHTPGGSFHANEIGGVAVSTVVRAAVPAAPPAGMAYHAWFDGRGGWVDLGALEGDDGGSVLDVRVERLRLEDQTAFAVHLVPAEAAVAGVPAGFPVLRVDLRGLSTS